MNWFLGLTLGVLLAVAGILGALVNSKVQEFQHSSSPTATYAVQTPAGMCPTEDSCSTAYYNGRWTITTVTP